MKVLRRYLGFLIIVLVLAGIIAGGWYYWKQANRKPVEERYQLAEAEIGEITQSVTANGTLNPVVLVSVGTQVSGTVRKLSADFNDRVQAGQILLELDPTTLQAAVEQSSGEVANARALQRLAQTEEARMRDLFAQEYVSRQDLDKAIQVRETAAAQVRTALGRLSRDRANLSYSVIRSPVAGVVVSREVDVGQTVAASFQTPTLFKIAQDLSRMQINSNVAEADIGKIKVAQTVRFTVDAFPGQRFEGRVEQIRLNPITQQNVVTYNVVVSVANPDHTLLPGMTAYIGVVIDERKEALLVPNAALRFKPSEAGAKRNPTTRRRNGGGNAGPTVYKLVGDKLEPVKIQTGISDSRFTEVTGGGLQAGDRLVMEELASDKKAAGGPPQNFRVRMF